MENTLCCFTCWNWWPRNDYHSFRINGMGHKALAFTGDIITLADATSMVHEAVKAWGTVDLLVNVAGMAPHTTLPVEATPLSKWQEVIQKNLTTFYNCVEAASSIMTGQRKINGMGHEALAFTGDIVTLADATSMVREVKYRYSSTCSAHRKKVMKFVPRLTTWATRHCSLQATSLFFLIPLQWFARAFQAWGTIDILANVAGMTPETTLFVETMLLSQ